MDTNLCTYHLVKAFIIDSFFIHYRLIFICYVLANFIDCVSRIHIAYEEAVHVDYHNVFLLSSISTGLK